MSNKTINQLPTANTIDGSADLLPIYTSSLQATQSISRNTYLGITGSPVGTSDSQSLTNKTIGNTNTITVKDTLFTLQDDGDTTKQARFQLSGLTTATTRTYTLPDTSDTLVTLAATQTLTNKTLTSPTINTAIISNPTLTVDSISGFSTSTIVSVAGLSISNGVLNTNNSVKTSNIQAAAVTPDKLSAAGRMAVVTTEETTTSTSYTDLATVTDTVTVTIGANGYALILISVAITNSNGVQGGFVSYAASGSNTIASSDARALIIQPSTGGLYNSGTFTYLATGLVAGSTTFKLKYRATANTAFFKNRYISVIPL